MAVTIARYVRILKLIREPVQIQHEIHLKLPPDQQFEPTFWGDGTHERLRQLQRELLPDGSRPQRPRTFRLIGWAALFRNVDPARDLVGISQIALEGHLGG